MNPGRNSSFWGWISAFTIFFSWKVLGTRWYLLEQENYLRNMWLRTVLPTYFLNCYSIYFYFLINRFILTGGELLYNIVLVLQYINMNPPRVYTCSPSWPSFPTSLPVPSLWVIPLKQPQAFCIMHWTWTGDSFHIWYYTCFNAILVARTWKQPRCPSADEWVRKLWYIYTMEYYSAIQKNTSETVLMKWMKLEPIIQSEVSQKEKHQYSILMHIYGI